jgi:hypothetical protein
MSNSLFFKIKNSVTTDKRLLLEIFFKDWVDESCNNEVKYKVERDEQSGIVPMHETFRVDFDHREDALAICLKGVPQEFQSYLEIVR